MINSAKELDLTQATKRRQAEEDSVLPNHRNTFMHRLHKNLKRKDSHRAKMTERRVAADTIEDLEAQILQDREAAKALQVNVRDLQSKKKALQQTTGVKRRRNTEKGKAHPESIPDELLSHAPSSSQGGMLNSIENIDAALLPNTSIMPPSSVMEQQTGLLPGGAAMDPYMFTESMLPFAQGASTLHIAGSSLDIPSYPASFTNWIEEPFSYGDNSQYDWNRHYRAMNNPLIQAAEQSQASSDSELRELGGPSGQYWTGPTSQSFDFSQWQ